MQYLQKPYTSFPILGRELRFGSRSSRRRCSYFGLLHNRCRFNFRCWLLLFLFRWWSSFFSWLFIRWCNMSFSFSRFRYDSNFGARYYSIAFTRYKLRKFKMLESLQLKQNLNMENTIAGKINK